MNRSTPLSLETPSDAGRWLCIAYAFPPVSRSGTYRTAGFVRYLGEQGWPATVITADPTSEPCDFQLLDRVPQGTRVVTTKWWNLARRAGRLSRWWRRRGLELSSTERVECVAAPDGSASQGVAVNGRRSLASRVVDACSWFLQTPDTRIGWIAPAVRAALRELHREPHDVVYSSSPYASAHLIAMLVSQLVRLPWVADFRDPWRGNPFREQPRGPADRWDAWLERKVMRHATRLVFAGPRMQEATTQRFPATAEKCCTILNGYDHDLLAGIVPQREAPRDELIITHAGEFYARRDPRAIFAALRRARLATPNGRRIRLQLVGSTTMEGRPLIELAREAGVDECVTVVGRVDHRTALALVMGSDAALLVGGSGSDGDLQIPAKLFEYLPARKPIIALVDRGSPVRDILHASRADALWAEPHDVDHIAEAMITLSRRTSGSPLFAWNRIEQFDRRRRAAELREMFAGLKTTAAKLRQVESEPIPEAQAEVEARSVAPASRPRLAALVHRVSSAEVAAR